MSEVKAEDVRTHELLERLVSVFEAKDGIVPSVPPLSQDLGQAKGHHSPRPKTAAEKVREYLMTHPSDKELPVRDLAEKIGVGKSTVSRVLNDSAIGAEE